MVSNQIIIGTDSYDDDKIAEGNCYVTNGIIAEELGTDTMDITVLSNTALKYPYGTEVKFYHNESLLGKLRVNTVSRVGKQSYKINSHFRYGDFGQPDPLWGDLQWGNSRRSGR